MMRLAVTADLHYEHSDTSRRAAEALAEEICQSDADAVVLAGDTFAFDTDVLRACLRLFDGFDGAKCLVPGNHDVWVESEGDSWQVYGEAIPEVAGDEGFHVLDQGPLALDSVGIVGNMGWYDYSLADDSLGVPRRFYERKIAPGVAAAVPVARRLLEESDDIGPEARDLTTVWNDARFVRWPYLDDEVVAMMADRLREHIAEVESQVDSIVCVTHHLPFENMVHRYDAPKFAFTNAFMGSPKLGEAMLACPKVRFALCGHNHRPCRVSNGHIECINVGGSYPTKRFEMVEV